MNVQPDGQTVAHIYMSNINYIVKQMLEGIPTILG